MPTVEFCRVSRRVGDRSLDPRPFVEDMKALIDSGLTFAVVRGTRYVAADLKLDASETFLTGLLGFAEEDVLRQFEPDSFSWLKGDAEPIYGATRRTVVPFAMDLREHRRWAGYATSTRIRSRVFRDAFAATLNHAVNALGLLPSEWEVDPVMSAARVDEWITEFDAIIMFKRIIRLTNPLSDVDDARRKLRLLGGRVEERTMRGTQARPLQLRGNEAFRDEIAPVATGDMDIELRAKVGRGTQVFKSVDHTDSTTIRDYNDDLELGLELVLDAVREFSSRRGEVVHDESS